MAKVTGAREHAARLRAMTSGGGGRLVANVGRALYGGAQLIQAEAQISLTTGAVTGKNHVASLPGEPPNEQWGTLGDNIEAVQTGPLSAEVSSNASYSAALEYGSSKMAARPYMAPAVAKKRKEVVELVRRAVRSVTQSPRGA